MIKINRRNLQTGIGLSSVSAALAPHFARAQAEKQLKILILGGAGSIGVPRHLQDSAALLKDRVGRYLFSSSMSAYGLSTGEFPLAIGETFC